MASVLAWKSSKRWRMSHVLFDTRQCLCEGFETREVNLHAMRSGPGKHLKGLTLMGGVVTPEEVCLATIIPPSVRADSAALLLV